MRDLVSPVEIDPAPIGSNIERTYCYTAEEVILRHLADKQEAGG